MSDFLPPVVARLMGDVNDFQEKFGKANETMSQTEGKAASAGSAVSGRLGAGMAAGGAAVGAMGMELTHLGDGLETARKQLDAAGKAAGIDMDELDGITKKADASMQNFGHSSSDTDEALRKLVTAGRPAEEMTKDVALAADLAAAKHISLSDAAGMLAKGFAGNGRLFKEYGIDIKSVGGPGGAMDELAGKLKGQAASSVDTFGGKLEVAKTKVEDFAAGIGTKIGPAMAVAGPAIGGLGMVIQSGLIPTLLSGVGAAVSFGGAMIGTGIMAAQAALPVIIAWAPVILVVAALALAGYELYQHWGEVWGFVKAITSDAADWVKTHLELIALVVLAPIAPLILLWQHWDQVWGLIKGIASDAWDWLRHTISTGVDDVVGFVAGLPGRAVGALSSLGGDIAGVASDAMSSMWNAVSAGAGDVISYVEGIPGRVLGALGNLGSLLFNAGAAVLRGFYNGLKSVWGDVTGFVGSIGGWIASHKGPIEYDRTLLTPHGGAIMDGLVAGMRGGMGRVGAAVSDVTGMLGGVGGLGGGVGGRGSAVAGGGGTTVVHYTPTLVVQTATGDIPDSTIRKLRTQLFEMGNDIPSGNLLPGAA